MFLLLDVVASEYVSLCTQDSAKCTKKVFELLGYSCVPSCHIRMYSVHLVHDNDNIVRGVEHSKVDIPYELIIPFFIHVHLLFVEKIFFFTLLAHVPHSLTASTSTFLHNTFPYTIY